MYQRNNLSELLEKAYYRNIELGDKRVILRSCLNVIVDDDGAIVDDSRLHESWETIAEVSQKAKGVVILGHLGRPERKENKYSFSNVAAWLSERIFNIGKKLVLVENPEDIAGELAQGNIVLLENIRFFSGEESKNIEERNSFASELAKHVDLFINDAFADYRQSASTFDIAKKLPAYIGDVFYREVSSLVHFHKPERPFVAVLGGAKLSEKLDVMHALLQIADTVLVGGAMAYTLLKAQGGFVGSSLIENDKLEVATDMVYKAGTRLVLPQDHLIVEKFEEPTVGRYAYTIDSLIPPGKIAIDLGPKTIALYKEILQQASTILVNGPMGVFEWDAASAGTRELLQSVSNAENAYSVAGGGDSIAAMNKFGISGMKHISTGGGAMLAYIAYDTFPTLDVILDQHNV